MTITEKAPNPRKPPATRSTAFRLFFRTAAMGTFTCRPSALVAWNSGDSAILSRMNMPTMTSTKLNRKGIRQPQASRSSLGSSVTNRKAALPSSAPVAGPTWGIAAKSPRRFFGAYSNAIRMAPPHSPPKAMPWRKRRLVSITAAHTPTWSNVGSTPMARVANPISSKVMTSIGLRPILSPKCPNTMAPSGREM